MDGAAAARSPRPHSRRAAVSSIDAIIRCRHGHCAALDIHSLSLQPFVAFGNGHAAVHDGQLSVGVDTVIPHSQCNGSSLDGHILRGIHTVRACRDAEGAIQNVEEALFAVIRILGMYAVLSRRQVQCAACNANTVLSGKSGGRGMHRQLAAGYLQGILADDAVSLRTVHRQAAASVDGQGAFGENGTVHLIVIPLHEAAGGGKCVFCASRQCQEHFICRLDI